MRLIDADATLKGIDSAIALLRVACGKDALKHKAVDLVQHTRDFVAKMTTIDAVPVVRCKDCEYYKYEECVCPRMVMSDCAHYYPDPEDFCSYGERKDGE